MTETVTLEINQHIATLTFNRPHVMNAYNDEMAETLACLTTEVRLNPAIRAVCLQGAGKLFMAGGDLTYFQKNLPHIEQTVASLMPQVLTSIENLQRMNKPVIARVHGAVAGIGLSFMLACDLVIAANNTKFTTAYSKIGLSPDGGMSYFLPRLVGEKKAMELFLLGDTFDAATALHYGLINWAVEETSLTEFTQHVLTRLAAGPTQAFAHIKQLVNGNSHYSLSEQLQREATGFATCAKTDDFNQGLKAFLTKQTPQFEGK
ncbi:MAG: enoyl-CoA hydratase/isomerase family protein [Legionellales bacterium]|nr:enoyl-CoA hydratase/isomerase family protein [Legionellales bacterium]